MQAVVPGQIDDAHAAAAQDGPDLVAADGLRCRRQRWRRGPFRVRQIGRGAGAGLLRVAGYASLRGSQNRKSK